MNQQKLHRLHEAFPGKVTRTTAVDFAAGLIIREDGTQGYPLKLDEQGAQVWQFDLEGDPLELLAELLGRIEAIEARLPPGNGNGQAGVMGK